MTSRRQSSIAFQPGRIGNMRLKNRLVRSATFENAATEHGEVTDAQAEIYRTLAKGGIGLIITGHAAVHSRWSIVPHMTRITDDSFIPSIRTIARAVHGVGNDCKVVLQLNHLGRQSDHPVAPSSVYDSFLGQNARELTVEEIGEIIECFSQAIRRAREAEFDGVQLHAAHGWLLSSFLSPHTNRRDDEYGGNTLKRVRIMDEIWESAAKKVDGDFPILVKLNTDDCLPGGVDADEAVKVAAELARIGYAAVETSGGTWEALTRSEEELGWKPVFVPEARVGIKTKEQEAYFWQNAKKMKRDVKIPLILVGGLKSIDKIEEILHEGSVGFCAMARPLIRQPDLPNRWLRGIGGETAECKSCNACIDLEKSLGCKAENKQTE